MSDGSEFHRRGPANANALSPYIFELTLGTTSVWESNDLRARVHTALLVRYGIRARPDGMHER